MRKGNVIVGRITRADTSAFERITLTIAPDETVADSRVRVGQTVHIYSIENDPYTSEERAAVSKDLVGDRPYERAKDLMDAMIQRGWTPPKIPPMYKYDCGTFWRRNKNGSYIEVSHEDIVQMLNTWIGQ